VSFAHPGEYEQHDGLAEAIQIPHFAGASSALRVSSVAVSLSASHTRYL
jgi:hypothetical protein